MVAYASLVDPTPVIYKQAEVVYTKQVIEVSATDLADPSFNDYDNLTETPSTTEGVSALEVQPVECRCVEWLREVKGYQIKGDADTIVPNVATPFVYGVVILDYDGVRHVAGIKHIMLDRFMVEESNFEKCTPTERVIKMDNENIVGYYFKNPN